MIPLNAIGLILDILGVFFIGWSSFYSIDWKTLTRRRRKTIPGSLSMGISKPQDIPLYLDGAIGASLLLLGLILQLWGVLTKKEVLLLSWLPISVLFLILLSPFYFWKFRDKLADWWRSRTIGKDSEAVAEYWRKRRECEENQ